VCQKPEAIQFSLKSENIEILPILSAAIFKMAAIRSRFYFGQNILPTLLNIYAKSCGKWLPTKSAKFQCSLISMKIDI
jgi:hypothetical protein